ncbi:MAG TPA: hypothetical protein VF006_01240 [Longimicrobium sp.]
MMLVLVILDPGFYIARRNPDFTRGGVIVHSALTASPPLVSIQFTARYVHGCGVAALQPNKMVRVRSFPESGMTPAFIQRGQLHAPNASATNCGTDFGQIDIRLLISPDAVKAISNLP